MRFLGERTGSKQAASSSSNSFRSFPSAGSRNADRRRAECAVEEDHFVRLLQRRHFLSSAATAQAQTTFAYGGLWTRTLLSKLRSFSFAAPPLLPLQAVVDASCPPALPAAACHTARRSRNTVSARRNQWLPRSVKLTPSELFPDFSRPLRTRFTFRMVGCTRDDSTPPTDRTSLCPEAQACAIHSNQLLSPRRSSRNGSHSVTTLAGRGCLLSSLTAPSRPPAPHLPTDKYCPKPGRHSSSPQNLALRRPHVKFAPSSRRAWMSQADPARRICTQTTRARSRSFCVSSGALTPLPARRPGHVCRGLFASGKVRFLN